MPPADTQVRMFGEYAGVRLISKPPYPYRIAGRGPPGAPSEPEPEPEPELITSIRTAVPSLDRYVTCRAVTSGTWTLPGASAQVVTEASRASNRSTTEDVV